MPLLYTLLNLTKNAGVLFQLFTRRAHSRLLQGDGFRGSLHLDQHCCLNLTWGDYDNNGRLEVLISGLDAGNNPITQVWRNTVDGFTNINAGLPGVYISSVAWGDFDNDGLLDILLAGLKRFQTLPKPLLSRPVIGSRW